MGATCDLVLKGLTIHGLSLQANASWVTPHPNTSVARQAVACDPHATMGRCYAHGGLPATGTELYQSELWVWEFQADWKHVITDNTKPAARFDHALAFAGTKYHLFGGRNVTESFSDIWSFDPAASQWTQVRGHIFEGRSAHAFAATTPGQIFIHGGRKQWSTKNLSAQDDAWSFDIQTFEWTKTTVGGWTHNSSRS